jgi:hypothetical protein
MRAAAVEVYLQQAERAQAVQVAAARVLLQLRLLLQAPQIVAVVGVADFKVLLGLIMAAAQAVQALLFYLSQLLNTPAQRQVRQQLQLAVQIQY